MTRFVIRFIATSIVLLAGDIALASVGPTGYSLTRGFESIGYLFGGIPGLLIIIGVVVGLSLATWAIVHFARTDRHVAVAATFLAGIVGAAILVGSVGLRWIPFSVDALVPLVALVAIAAFTWLQGWVFDRTR